MATVGIANLSEQQLRALASLVDAVRAVKLRRKTDPLPDHLRVQIGDLIGMYRARDESPKEFAQRIVDTMTFWEEDLRGHLRPDSVMYVVWRNPGSKGTTDLLTPYLVLGDELRRVSHIYEVVTGRKAVRSKDGYPAFSFGGGGYNKVHELTSSFAEVFFGSKATAFRGETL